MPGPGQRVKSPRGRGFLWGRKKGRKSKEKSRPQTTARKPGTPTGRGGGDRGSQGIIPPWEGYFGGKVETEDQRSKRMEKEDIKVRGYMHGGKVKGYGGGGKVKGKK